jgi:hypothetical protein
MVAKPLQQWDLFIQRWRNQVEGSTKEQQRHLQRLCLIAARPNQPTKTV